MRDRRQARFLAYNLLCVGSERYHWTFRFLRDCITQGLITATKAAEWYSKAGCIANPKDAAKWAQKWKEAEDAK